MLPSFRLVCLFGQTVEFDRYLRCKPYSLFPGLAYLHILSIMHCVFVHNKNIYGENGNRKLQIEYPKNKRLRVEERDISLLIDTIRWDETYSGMMFLQCDVIMIYEN